MVLSEEAMDELANGYIEGIESKIKSEGYKVNLSDEAWKLIKESAKVSYKDGIEMGLVAAANGISNTVDDAVGKFLRKPEA